MPGKTLLAAMPPAPLNGTGFDALEEVISGA
jgi:hypothetical protein